MTFGGMRFGELTFSEMAFGEIKFSETPDDRCLTVHNEDFYTRLNAAETQSIGQITYFEFAVCGKNRNKMRAVHVVLL